MSVANWLNHLNVEINQPVLSISLRLRLKKLGSHKLLIWSTWLFIHIRYTSEMLFPKKKQNRYQLSYKEKEVPIYYPMLDYLMDDLQLVNKSDVYKVAVKHLYQQRKHAKMELVWIQRLTAFTKQCWRRYWRSGEWKANNIWMKKSKRIIQYYSARREDD